MSSTLKRINKMKKDKNIANDIQSGILNTRKLIGSLVLSLINTCHEAIGCPPLEPYSTVVKLDYTESHRVVVTINKYTFTQRLEKIKSKRNHQTIRHGDGLPIEVKHLLVDADAVSAEFRASLSELREDILAACNALVIKEKCIVAWEPFVIQSIPTKRIKDKKMVKNFNRDVASIKCVHGTTIFLNDDCPLTPSNIGDFD